ncbi:MAG: GNAT family N-acetyltransferase [Rickettsiales bacterium]|jgi:putative hemolysin|nr:GNAT family N-acetyltransferase [Rickettsiales bacterium]
MAIKVRDYTVRQARTKEEKRGLRRLRYRVFVEEEGAAADEEMRALGEEYDIYDLFADYMIVLHKNKIVGTYRIIDRAAAEKTGGFYTETEFNISKIKHIAGNIAEMSRACVDKEYREDALVMRMLWMGLAEYVLRNKIKVLFGTASWVGKNPVDSAMAISDLYYNHLAPPNLRAEVVADKMAGGIDRRLSQMKILPRAFVDPSKAALQRTPLIKGYLRLGATFGRGVFIDAPFNSYDVFVILQTKKIAAAYQSRFAGSPDAFAHLGLRPSAFKFFAKLIMSPITLAAGLARFLLTEEDADDAEAVEDNFND